MIRAVTMGLAVLATSVSFAAPPTAGAAPPGSQCGENLTAPQIALAVRQLPPASRDLDVPWDPNPYGGNFDPCATLSTALVTVQGATGGSPEQALFFHDGEYVGTATAMAYPYISLDEDQSADDTVVLEFKDVRNVCTACAAPIDVVHYRWQDDHVQMLDPAPPSPG